MIGADCPRVSDFVTLLQVTYSGFANNNRPFVGAEPSQTPKFLPPHPHSLAPAKLNMYLLNKVIANSRLPEKHLTPPRGVEINSAYFTAIRRTLNPAAGCRGRSLPANEIKNFPPSQGEGGWVKEFMKIKWLRTVCATESLATPHPPLRRSPFSRRRRQGGGCGATPREDAKGRARGSF